MRLARTSGDHTTVGGGELGATTKKGRGPRKIRLLLWKLPAGQLRSDVHVLERMRLLLLRLFSRRAQRVTRNAASVGVAPGATPTSQPVTVSQLPSRSKREGPRHMDKRLTGDGITKQWLALSIRQDLSRV